MNYIHIALYINLARRTDKREHIENELTKYSICNYYFDHKNASSDTDSKKSFYLNEKGLLTKKIRKIFVTPTGKVFDSGPILKTT